MKIVIIIALLIMAAAAVIYFSPGPGTPGQFESAVLDRDEYDRAVQDLAVKIYDLSPTPPTEQTWTVREVEFVKNEPYAYVVYHDTHNIFRILVETGRDNSYRTIAAFEADRNGWRLTHGEDLSKGKETVIIKPNN